MEEIPLYPLLYYEGGDDPPKLHFPSSSIVLDQPPGGNTLCGKNALYTGPALILFKRIDSISRIEYIVGTC